MSEARSRSTLRRPTSSTSTSSAVRRTSHASGDRRARLGPALHPAYQRDGVEPRVVLDGANDGEGAGGPGDWQTSVPQRSNPGRANAGLSRRYVPAR